MSAAFTPGPWTFSRWGGYGDTRFYVAQADGAPYTPNYSDVATLVAETCSGERVAVQEANARLIAAAPDLLEKASFVLAMCESIGSFQNGVTDPTGSIDEGEVRAGELLNDLRAAIAKATGGA